MIIRSNVFFFFFFIGCFKGHVERKGKIGVCVAVCCLLVFICIVRSRVSQPVYVHVYTSCGECQPMSVMYVRVCEFDDCVLSRPCISFPWFFLYFFFFYINFLAVEAAVQSMKP